MLFLLHHNLTVNVTDVQGRSDHSNGCGALCQPSAQHGRVARDGEEHQLLLVGGDFLTFACQVNQLLANMLDGRPEESTIVNGVEVPFLALFTSSFLKRDFLHEMCV